MCKLLASGNMFLTNQDHMNLMASGNMLLTSQDHVNMMTVLMRDSALCHILEWLRDQTSRPDAGDPCSLHGLNT